MVEQGSPFGGSIATRHVLKGGHALKDSHFTPSGSMSDVLEVFELRDGVLVLVSPDKDDEIDLWFWLSGGEVVESDGIFHLVLSFFGCDLNATRR